MRNGHHRTPLFEGRTLVAVPSNAGPATMPNYPALAAQGIYTDPATGIRVFAGQRAETFYIDLGAVFDTLNLRSYLPLLNGPGEDADNVNPFGVNRFTGVEHQHDRDRGSDHARHERRQTRGHVRQPDHRHVRRAPPRQKIRILNDKDGDPDGNGTVRASVTARQSARERAPHQHADEGQAGTRRHPEQEAKFQDFYKNPVLATAFSLVYGVPIVPLDGSPASNRTDLMSILLKYPGQSLNGSIAITRAPTCCGSTSACHRPPRKTRAGSAQR